MAGECRDVDLSFTPEIDEATLMNCATAHYGIKVEAAISDCSPLLASDVIPVVIDPNVLGSSCRGFADPNVDPLLDLSEAIRQCPKKMFSTLAQAENCVLDLVRAEDPSGNCRPVEIKISSVPDSINTLPNCGTEHFDTTVSATIQGCEALETSKTLALIVDSNTQDPSCDILLGPNIPPSLNVEEAVIHCSGKMFSSAEDVQSCVLEYSAAKDQSGGCRPVVMSVDSQVNEDRSQPNCGTQHVDVTVTAAIADCEYSLSTSSTLDAVVDPASRVSGCDYGSLGVYRNPAVNVSEAFAHCDGRVFPTVEDAEECVLRHTVAEDLAGDNCRPVSVESSASQVGSCGYHVVATATVDSCGTLETTSSPVVKVTVDSTPPVVSCSFGSNTLEDTGPGIYVNPNLGYSVTDNCDDDEGHIRVVLETFSNEMDVIHSRMATHTRTFSGVQVDDRGNVREFFDVNVYVSAGICSTDSSGNCVTDPSAEGRRFYVTHLTATDPAGLSSHTQCFTEVVPSGSNNGPTPHDGVFPQLFQLDKTAFEALPDGSGGV